MIYKFINASVDSQVTGGNLFELINEEISRVAANEYTEEGTSMYDFITLHSNDADEIERLQGDAVNTIIKRNYDIVTVIPDISNEHVIQFNVPDLPLEEGYTVKYHIKDELDRFIVLNVCAAWFQARAKDKVEEFANRAQVALDKATYMLHTRKVPTRS